MNCFFLMLPRALGTNKKNPMILSDTNPVRGVNFDVSYQDDELVAEGMLGFICSFLEETD